MKPVMFSGKTLKVNEIGDVTSMKSQFRGSPEVEVRHRAETRDHLEYITANKLFNVGGSAWGHHSVGADDVYAHFYGDHSLKVVVPKKGADPAGPTEHIIVNIHSTDQDGNETRMTMSAATFGMTEIAIAITCLALVAKVGIASMLAEDAIVEAGVLAGEAMGEEAVEITAAEVLGPVGIALAILAFIVMLGMYLGARNIALNLRYENRSKRAVRLVECFAYDVDDIKVPVDVKGLHMMDGFDVYDCISYQNTNESKYKGVGLSLAFTGDGAGRLLVCIRNDIYGNPQMNIAVSDQSAHAFYDNCNGGNRQLNHDVAWGPLTVKNYLDPDGFNNYKFSGIISFHEKE
jgi:hypothetical protein